MDLGAGDFSDVEMMKKLGWQCEGVDLSIGTNLEENYFSPGAPFDFVCSNHVLHFLKNKKTLVESAYNNLKVGGIFFFQDLERSDLTTDMYFSEREMKQLIKEVGFKIIESHKSSFFDDKPDHMHWHDIIEIVAER